MLHCVQHDNSNLALVYVIFVIFVVDLLFFGFSLRLGDFA
jgi:hypothetical protein